MSSEDPKSNPRDILRARARVLSQEAIDQEPAAGRLQVIEFIVGKERYAVESTSLREVYPLKELTPIPCTPAFIVGMINVRGQILAVIDLRKLFDLPPAGLTDLNKVLILHDRVLQVGILADVVTGVRGVLSDEIQTSLPTLTGIRADYLRGVTNDGVVILDASRILASDRLVVHEEVEA